MFSKSKSTAICSTEMIKVTMVGIIKVYCISNLMKILSNEISTNTIDVG